MYCYGGLHYLHKLLQYHTSTTLYDQLRCLQLLCRRRGSRGSWKARVGWSSPRSISVLIRQRTTRSRCFSARECRQLVTVVSSQTIRYPLYFPLTSDATMQQPAPPTPLPRSPSCFQDRCLESTPEYPIGSVSYFRVSSQQENIHPGWFTSRSPSLDCHIILRRLSLFTCFVNISWLWT